MKNENEMNRKLGTWFKSLWPDFYHFKAADKYQQGISDFILWGEGTSCGLESKFIVSIPDIGKRWLTHTFSPAQRNFLRSLQKTGNRSYGLIGVKERKQMLLILPDLIDKTGNISSDEGGKWFPITKMGAGELIDEVFKDMNHG